MPAATRPAAAAEHHVHVRSFIGPDRVTMSIELDRRPFWRVDHERDAAVVEGEWQETVAFCVAEFERRLATARVILHERVEQDKQHRHYLVDQRLAFARSRQMALALLGKDAWREAVAQGYIEVPSQMFRGRVYRLPLPYRLRQRCGHGRREYRWVHLDENPEAWEPWGFEPLRQVAHLCVHPAFEGGVYGYDAALSHYLHIQGNEHEWLSAANIFPTAPGWPTLGMRHPEESLHG